MRGEPNGPRAIDVDILFMGALRRDGPAPVLPHPRLHLRRFVLEPLAEILPDLVHPGLGARVAELLRACADRSSVTRFAGGAGVSALHHLAVEGPIGVGKTTVVDRLAQHFEAKKAVEDWSTNPFLAPSTTAGRAPRSRRSSSSCSRATGSSRS